MGYAKGRNVRVEVAKTYGTAKAVTAISKADPGVATSADHALAVGSVGYLVNLVGMYEAEGQAVRVGAGTDDTFALVGLDTTDFTDLSGNGQFIPVTAWETVSPSTNYDISGGDSDKQDVTVLLDKRKQEEAGLLAAETVTFGVRSELVPGPAMKIIRQAALDQAFVVFRITFKSGEQRLFRGQPSLPGESVQQGQIGTGSFTSTVKGQVLFLPAV